MTLDREELHEVHEAQRRMALAHVEAVMQMADTTANDPLIAAMQRAHDVLKREPPPPGAGRREWLNDVLAELATTD